MSENNADWEAIAQFWQTKYQEQLLHFTQVITVMSRSALMKSTEQPVSVSENGKAPAKVIVDKP